MPDVDIEGLTEAVAAPLTRPSREAFVEVNGGMGPKGEGGHPMVKGGGKARGVLRRRAIRRERKEGGRRCDGPRGPK